MLSGLVLNQNNDLVEVYIIEKKKVAFLFIPPILKKSIDIGHRYHLMNYSHGYAFAWKGGLSYGKHNFN